jgi:type IV pilus assembly protein PilC
MSNSNLKTFRWKGKNNFGYVVKGKASAINSAEIARNLQQQGVISFQISRDYSFLDFFQQSKIFLFENKKLILLELVFVVQQLSMLLSAHVPLAQAFEVIQSYHDNLSLTVRKILQKCSAHIQSGYTLAQAFSYHSRYFSDFFCRWIEAGECSGTLDVLLEHWIFYQEKNEQTRQKIKKALTYPVFILITTMLVAILLLLAVLPVFERLFSQMGAELPRLTHYVIFLARIFNKYGLFLLLFLGGALAIVWKIRLRLPRLLFFFDKWILAVPLVGKILQYIALARFSRTLSILLSAGFPLSEALNWTSKVMNNRFLTQIVLHCHEAVILGTALSKNMAMFSCFSPLLKQMVAVGEASGTLDKTLLHTANFYEKQVSHSLERITELIEPMLMLIVGTIAGIFIVAMYLPIFKLGALF